MSSEFGKKGPMVHSYLRMDTRFPHVWCPGCGIGIMLGGMIHAIDELGIPKEKILLASGIGCTSRMPGYLDTDTFHLLHGRALAAATGVKMARPEMEVIVVGGDGDMLAIGGNHFIHAARRNIGITCIVLNNYNYAMTGGQQSPTTPEHMFATTAPYGAIDRPSDPCALAEACGAAFVARTTAYNFMEIKRFIKTALERKGFSIVEVVAQCPTLFGRINRMPRAKDVLTWIKKRTVTRKAAQKLSEDELKGKIVT
ncbi:2-oxoacid:ferredoxin oxidoreductase subunit beta, partial [candidate division WOR-3 bacterium]|nr:2-oxoacid:ferredoxin oxidoreductase subunit beta [candidate division WOR-3 bacterium]MBD3364263.1 2-oxoacid:ferredoxin oxidoreductase subunit beta [candidate division WOR-3 bacterium]